MAYQKVKANLLKLPERDQDMLTYLSMEYSHEEMSRIFKIPHGTLRTNIFRARKHLKELVKDKDLEGMLR